MRVTRACIHVSVTPLPHDSGWKHRSVTVCEKMEFEGICVLPGDFSSLPGDHLGRNSPAFHTHVLAAPPLSEH